MIKNRLIPTLALAGATSLAAMLTPVAATAVTFTVNRSWSESGNNASLVGTVDVPVGSYTIQNGTPNPFTNVNLTLTVNSNPFTLNTANTSNISGTGQFLVNATSSTLTFNTANADGSNPADLAFLNSSTGFGGPFYVIGTDGDPGFEIAINTSPNVAASVALSVTFGTVQQVQQVPEPASLFGLGVLSTLGAASTLKRKLKPSQSIEKETTKVG
ncbi:MULTISPECIES: PEP-CTERM sorting domain-containing protein [unclassified Microcystis]|uniref:PEP-CTERM sorting domain-containing protein n=1 Tax=unclassified Microcystis TaxID=2643300 RepID=UPI0011907EA0|nr:MULTISPECIES: PEP-CTERM sorting domain-containing protein [unclassified Microcystis]MCA2926838.1 PEP-CTERM sorting domain-containing protein [Microcystis sp. M020S1]MCA2935587.1 PEP-CTERM sorting domain-containing protein [Microcystis sp. M015S1]MCA2618528.1 PEP-CTERM sorting domain-containing protein [Microcystis sp. M099S2]MCA2652162.1 PEP-CTERM sorting domain-containing protein [Microcystis sp. M065S2]MCA2679784.1 PEP-CTERM sorting domain-containing protein [Microcystis sp. M043S2]